MQLLRDSTLLLLFVVAAVGYLIGSSIGTVGTLAGFLFGVLISLNIETLRGWIASLTASDVFSPELYFLSQLPADMDPRETITVIIMALALSFLATIYPAWRAARIRPVTPCAKPWPRPRTCRS